MFEHLNQAKEHSGITGRPENKNDVRQEAMRMANEWVRKMKGRFYNRAFGVGFITAMKLLDSGQAVLVENDVISGRSEYAMSIGDSVRAAELHTSIDERFSREILHPEDVRELLNGVLGEEVVERNIGAVIRSPEEIPMPAHYHGTARYEAGHCTRSPQRGARSEVVLTPTAFRNAAPDQVLRVLLHEAVGHAVDYQNDDRMPMRFRREIPQGLHEIVRGNNPTIYSYVNSYEGDRSDEAREDAVQAEEVFALLMEDALTMSPLDAEDPLRRESIERQFTVRLSRSHGISEHAAAPYAHILSLVAEVRGQQFFQHGQEVVYGISMRMGVRQIQAQEAERRAEQERNRERGIRVVRGRLQQLVMPEIADRLVEWGRGYPESFHRAQDDLKYLEEIEDRMFEPFEGATAEQIRSLEALGIRYEKMYQHLESDRGAYYDEFARTLKNPFLQKLFHQMVSYSSGKRFDVLQDIHRDIEATLHGDVSDRLRNHVNEFNRILALADNPAISNAEERTAFRQAINRYLDEQIRGGYEARMHSRNPDLQGLLNDLEGAPGDRSGSERDED